MSSQVFSFASSKPIATQPNAAGEKLIARSSNAADTGNLSTIGIVGSAASSETNALLGKREIETTALFKSLTKAGLSAAQAGTVTVYGQGTAGTAQIRVENNPADGDTLTIGLAGFTQVYRFKTTTAQAFDVKIGANAAATAANLKKAINADGAGDGSDYHTGTTAHPHLSGAISGSYVNITDRIAIARQLAWSFAQSASNFSLPTTLAGAVTGALLATLTAGSTEQYKTFKSATEDLATKTVPGLFTGTSKPVFVGGKVCALRFKAENVGSGIAVNYQTSTDQINWSNGASSISNLDDNSVATPLVVKPSEQNIEFIRLNITTNANTADAAVDARVIS